MAEMTTHGRTPELADRLALKIKPDSWPLMYQNWGKLLFIHWRVPVDFVRRHIPRELGIDTYDGSAWVAITPFTLWGLRPVFLPPLPLISSFHEINVRTYVYKDGVPGVWFFSLDANSNFNVLAARTFYHLPYKSSSIDLNEDGPSINYKVKRPASHPASFRARWTRRGPMPVAEPTSLEFFLTERYTLYTASGNSLYRCRIHHETWPLQHAELDFIETNLFPADGPSEPEGSPIVFAGGPVNVDVWPIEKIGHATPPQV